MGVVPWSDPPTEGVNESAGGPSIFVEGPRNVPQSWCGSLGDGCGVLLLSGDRSSPWEAAVSSESEARLKVVGGGSNDGITEQGRTTWN